MLAMTKEDFPSLPMDVIDDVSFRHNLRDNSTTEIIHASSKSRPLFAMGH